MPVYAAVIILVLLVCIVALAIWGAGEREARHMAEEDLVMARVRGEALAEQTPFPFGEELP